MMEGLGCQVGDFCIWSSVLQGFASFQTIIRLEIMVLWLLIDLFEEFRACLQYYSAIFIFLDTT